jgi:ferric iron reductase protein FhuF
LNADRHQISIVQKVGEVTVGEYDCFAGHLAASDDPRPSVGVDRLLDDGMRAAIEEHFAKKFKEFDPRAVHSSCLKRYLNAFLPPVLLADLFLLRSLPVALDQVSFILGEDARIAAVKLNDKGKDTSDADPFGRFGSLIFDHFEPLIEIWAARTDVTRRVYWSNVGNTFEAMLRRVELVSGMSPRLEGAQRLLSEPHWPDGRINPLFDAVYYLPEADKSERRRRVCCLQYMLPDRRFCKACPIDEARQSSVSGAIC